MRIVLAAIVTGLALHAWGWVSAKWLPWPTPPSGPLVATPFTAPVPLPLFARTDPRIADVMSDPDFEPTASDIAAASMPPAFSRPATPPLNQRITTASVLVNLAIGLVAAVTVAVIRRESKDCFFKITLLALFGVLCILITDVSASVWMSWPIEYTVVACVDHMLSMAIAGSIATVFLGVKIRKSPPAAPSAADR